MPIAYSCVAHHRRILAEAGQQSNLVQAIISKLPSDTAAKKSYEYEGQFYHMTISEDGLVFFCMADEEMGHRVCYAFLQEITRRFMAVYGYSFSTAEAMSLNDFSRVLKEQMDYYSYDPNTDAVRKVKGQIENVKTQMIENIDKVLDRGDKIEVLVDKTDHLQTQSNTFKAVSKSVKRKMWWQNKKLMLCGVCVALVIIAVIVVVVLYFLGVFGGGSKNNS